MSACGGGGEPAAPEKAAADSAGYVAGHCEQRRFEGSDFTACRYDPHRHRLELFVDDADGPLRSFDRLEAHLGERADRLLFAMNAGMFDSSGMPIGLYIEEGDERRPINRREGPGNFHLLPNGVFAVAADGTPTVVPTEAWNEQEARWATQSGPMLVIDGALHPRFQANGPSLHIRNGVGVTDADIAWFAVSDGPVSFGRFARFFRDSLGCADALFLDGNVSSLWDPEAGRKDGLTPLGPIVAIFERD